MPTVDVHPPRAPPLPVTNPLPPLLKTPFGLAMIEIQGTLNISQPSIDPIQEVGRLVFPNIPAGTVPDSDDTKWMKKVLLYIGKNQRLTGDVRKLPKPVAVIRRKEQSEDDNDAEASGAVVDELEIMDIVRYKLFFGGRPEFV